MFTGLVEEVGTWLRIEARTGAARAHIACKLGQQEPLVLGESVSVAGVCLTVAAMHTQGFEADVSEETLAKTKLGELARGAGVNLERASRLGARMGGHVVLGHVDTKGRVSQLESVGTTLRAWFEAPVEFARFIAPKGSIAIDGTSLTVNEVVDEADAVRFSVMLVPHTLVGTTLSQLAKGEVANLEMDVLARYVVRNLQLGSSTDDASRRDERLMGLLERNGYVR